jgi:hypothetical protein
MRLDELPLDQQDSAVYCHSCGTIRSEEELNNCDLCGTPICGLDGCSRRCVCDLILRFHPLGPLQAMS